MPVTLSIHSNIRNYDAVFEETAEFIETLASYPQACFIVDQNVWNIYAKTLLKKLPQENIILVPIDEDHKNLVAVQELYDQIVERPAKRNLTMISFGGGILQDISGFAASTIYRGIQWIFVPTTLLAQADSCIGSKTSLNYHNYKNLIGTFYPPARIHIYPEFLKTQLDMDFYSGFGEVIKLHLMGGRNLFRYLVEQVFHIIQRQTTPLLQAIQQSLNVKLDYMTGDEFDTGRRNLLNYGHDFGHAIESTSHFEIPHGQAVVLGMLAANLVSRQRGILSASLEQEIAKTLLLPSLAIKPSRESLGSDSVISAMKKDKKRTGDKLALIMMNDDFEFTRINDLTPEEVGITLDELKHQLGY